jgi:hypothetical protein
MSPVMEKLKSEFHIDSQLDINTISDKVLEAIFEAVDSTSEVARRIITRRPFYFVEQLKCLTDEKTFLQIAPLFAPPKFTFWDKLSGKCIQLRPDSTQVLIANLESEQYEKGADERKLERLFKKAVAASYKVFAIPNAEAAADIISEILLKFGKKAVPAFWDDWEQRPSRRYLDPAYCVVQFVEGLTKEQELEIIAKQDLQVQTAHRSPGFYTLWIPSEKRDLATLAQLLRQLNGLDTVRFTRPNYLGFDEVEQTSASSTTGSPSGADDPPWNLALAHVPQAWKLFPAKGSPNVVIAVVDSGVDENFRVKQAMIGTLRQMTAHSQSTPAATARSLPGSLLARMTVEVSMGSVPDVGFCR